MTKSDSHGFMHHVCKSASGFRLLFSASITVSLLMLLWVPFVDLNSGTGAIVGLNFVLGLVFSAFFGAMLLICRRRIPQHDRDESADRSRPRH